MKTIISSFILIILFACKKNDFINDNKNLSKISIKITDTAKASAKLTFGEIKLIEYQFPKEWNLLEEIDENDPNFKIDKISSKGYDSIFYFIEKNEINYYNSLKYNKSKSILIPQQKLINILSLYEKNVVLDRAHQVETISKSPQYSLKLYKSGDRYKDLLTMIESEKLTFDYLCLVTFDNNKTPIDYLLLYYNNYNSVMSYKRYFFIDNGLNIYLKDFDTNEQTVRFQNEKKIKINKDGYFKQE